MTEAIYPRDYSLLGRDAKLAVEQGLANAQWYQAPIARARMKELMKRSDGPAIRDTLVWIACFVVTAGFAIYLFPSWWSLPFFLAYGYIRFVKTPGVRAAKGRSFVVECNFSLICVLKFINKSLCG